MKTCHLHKWNFNQVKPKMSKISKAITEVNLWLMHPVTTVFLGMFPLEAPSVQLIRYFLFSVGTGQCHSIRKSSKTVELAEKKKLARLNIAFCNHWKQNFEHRCLVAGKTHLCPVSATSIFVVSDTVCIVCLLISGFYKDSAWKGKRNCPSWENVLSDTEKGVVCIRKSKCNSVRHGSCLSGPYNIYGLPDIFFLLKLPGVNISSASQPDEIMSWNVIPMNTNKEIQIHVYLTLKLTSSPTWACLLRRKITSEARSTYSVLISVLSLFWNGADTSFSRFLASVRIFVELVSFCKQIRKI